MPSSLSLCDGAVYCICDLNHRALRVHKQLQAWSKVEHPLAFSCQTHAYEISKFKKEACTYRCTKTGIYWGIQKKESFNHQISMSCGGSQHGDNRNQEHGPDGWAVAGGPSGIFAAGKKDSKQKALSKTNSSSNMFHMMKSTDDTSALQNPSSSFSQPSSDTSSPSTRPSIPFLLLTQSRMIHVLQTTQWTDTLPKKASLQTKLQLPLTNSAIASHHFDTHRPSVSPMTPANPPQPHLYARNHLTISPETPVVLLPPSSLAQVIHPVTLIDHRPLRSSSHYPCYFTHALKAGTSFPHLDPYSHLGYHVIQPATEVTLHASFSIHNTQY